MQAHSIVRAAYGELLEGLHALSKPSNQSEIGVEHVPQQEEAIVVELRQIAERETAGPPQALGSMTCQAIRLSGLGSSSTIRVSFVDMFVPVLQQWHSRILAMVEVDNSLVPHLLVEVMVTPGETCAVHIDFIPRVPADKLPKEYSSIDAVLRGHMLGLESRCKNNSKVDLFPSRPNLIGAIPRSANPFSAVLRGEHSVSVFGSTLRELVGEWLALVNVPGATLENLDGLEESSWLAEKELDRSLLNPRDDPLASRVKSHCGEDILIFARSELNLSPLTEEFSQPRTVGLADVSLHNLNVASPVESVEEWARENLVEDSDDETVTSSRSKGANSGSSGFFWGFGDTPERKGSSASQASTVDKTSLPRLPLKNMIVPKVEKENSQGSIGSDSPASSFEHISEEDTSWFGGSESEIRALEEHDNKLKLILSDLRLKTVADLRAQDNKLQLGPFVGGSKSLFIHIHNASYLPLVLDEYHGKNVKWPILPPPRITAGGEAEVACEASSNLMPLIEGDISFCTPVGHPVGNVEFKITWNSSINNWSTYSVGATPGWRVERVYSSGIQGKHLATRFVFTRAYSPLERSLHLTMAEPESDDMPRVSTSDDGVVGRRPSAGSGQREVKVVLLDCALDRSINSRFHATSERAKHIAAWLGVCGNPSRGRDTRAELDFVVLQNVYAEHGKRELLSVFSQTLGLLHVTTDIGPRGINPNHAGILIASRYPVLFQRYISFPSHGGCSHPAIRLPRGAYGGVLFVLYDLSSVAPGKRMIIICTTIPNQSVVWNRLDSALSSMLPELITFDPQLSNTGAMLLGKFEGVPSMQDWWKARREDASAVRTFVPRDIMVRSNPMAVPDTGAETGSSEGARQSTELQAIGTYSSSKYPYTWDPSHNSLAAASITQESSSPCVSMPCRVSCVLALDWLVADASSLVQPQEKPKEKGQVCNSYSSIPCSFCLLNLDYLKQCPLKSNSRAHFLGHRFFKALSTIHWLQMFKGWFSTSTSKERASGGKLNPQDALTLAKALDTQRSEQGGEELKLRLQQMQCVQYSVEQLGIVSSTQPTDHSAVVATLRLL